MKNIIEYSDRLNKDTYITKTKLLKRGWTEFLISHFVPEPHNLRPNYMYRSAAPIKLYKIDIIESIEDTAEFKNLLKGVDKRKKASIKGAKTKREKLLKQIDSVEIQVPILTYNDLLKKAIEHYNERQNDIGNYIKLADKKSDKAFLQRIQVNYIRHMLTSYDEELGKIFGKVGVQDAYKEIRNKLFKEISDAYPYLEKECDRQRDWLTQR